MGLQLWKIRENTKISAKESLGYSELKTHKSWFNEGCTKLFNQRKEAKFQRLQDPREIKRGSLNSVQNLLSSRLLSKNLDIGMYKIVILPVVLYGCETWSLTLRDTD
jgi:hypothetical protein